MDDSLKKSFENVKEKLERCCLGVEQLRRDTIEAEALLEEKVTKRNEIEKRIETGSNALKTEVETSKSLLENRLKLNRHELEQSIQTTKLEEVRKELRLQTIQRRELIIEMIKVKEEVGMLEDAETRASVKESSDDDEDRKEVEEMKKLLQFNLDKLKEEQGQLMANLKAGQQYVNSLQSDRTLLDGLVKMADQEHRRLKEEALAKEIKLVATTPSQASKPVLEVETHNHSKPSETLEELELILAEKFCELESLQTMLDQTLEINRKLELF